MNILMALLIGLAVNLDNLLIGINLGIRRQRLTLWQNLLIGSTTGLCAFGSACAARLISGNFLVYTNLIGAAIMIFFGIFCLYQGLTDKEEAPDISAAPRFFDVLVLGFVLAVNCIPPSFGARSHEALSLLGRLLLHAFLLPQHPYQRAAGAAVSSL